MVQLLKEQSGIPKTFEDNVILRVQYHQKCEQDKEARDIALASFQLHSTLFFNLCLWTYDPRINPADRPFILYDFQEDYVLQVDKAITTGENLLTEKTRDMGVSWMILGEFLRRWLLFDETFLIGSRVEAKVDTIGNIDSLFERLRYMLRTMPQWMLGACGYDKRNSSYMKLFKDNGSSIVGESMNDKFSRQGRFKAILLDEFAFIERAEVVWTACGDSAPCKLPVSTPNGSMNKFARLRKEGKTKVVSLHWKAHPHKTKAWYDKECLKRTEREIAQELDINYTVSAGKPFYGGFMRSIHSKQLDVIKDKELILGWDYGYHHPCCIISQIDVKGRWIILDCLFGEDELIDEFGNKVKQFLNTNYRGMSIVSYGDPAGNQESDKSRKTSVQILHDIGFSVYSIPSNTSQTNYNARKKIIEGKFKQLIDGVPALIINDIPRTQLIIEAFEGGWHYPEANKHGYIEERPVKEGYYEHPINSIDYIAVNMFSPVKEKQTDSGSISYKTVGVMKDVHFDLDDEDSNVSRYRRVSQGANSQYE